MTFESVSLFQVAALVCGALALGAQVFVWWAKKYKKKLLDVAKAYTDALDRGDADELARLRGITRPLYAKYGPKRAQAFEKLGLGEELIVRERWAEARDVLASVDRALLMRAQRPGALTNLAYTMAHAGDPKRACALAAQALTEAGDDPTYPPEKLANLQGTHGIALSLAGHHVEAVSRLQSLPDAAGSRRALAVRAFYLGVSLEALDRHAEARRVWEIGAQKDGPFAQRSRERMSG